MSELIITSDSVRESESESSLSLSAQAYIINGPRFITFGATLIKLAITEVKVFSFFCHFCRTQAGHFNSALRPCRTNS